MEMRLAMAIAMAAGLCAGTAGADDHLFQATQHGLSNKSPDQPPFAANKAGYGGDLAPGQGSPFAGEDLQTPATDAAAANVHANVKPREPK